MLKVAAVLCLLALPALAEVDFLHDDTPFSGDELIETCGPEGNVAYCAGYLHAWFDGRQCHNRLAARIETLALMNSRDDLDSGGMNANDLLLSIVIGLELCR